MDRIKILIADDHALMRDGIRRILEREPDFEVVAEAGDCRCAPVVIEDNPTYPNLIGRIEHRAEFGAIVRGKGK